MDEAISARFEWNAEEMTEALATHHGLAMRRPFRILLGLLILIYLAGTLGVPLAIILDTRSLPETRRNAFIAFAVVCFLWVWLTTCVRRRVFLRRKARKVFRSMPGQRHAVVWSITSDSLCNQTPLSSSTILWPLFIKVVETPKGFLLYQSIQFFNWIPAHAFASEEKLKMFSELARERGSNYVLAGKSQFPAKPEPVGLDEF